jgi:hypothetical protein
MAGWFCQRAILSRIHLREINRNCHIYFFYFQNYLCTPRSKNDLCRAFSCSHLNILSDIGSPTMKAWKCMYPKEQNLENTLGFRWSGCELNNMHMSFGRLPLPYKRFGWKPLTRRSSQRRCVASSPSWGRHRGAPVPDLSMLGSYISLHFGEVGLFW